MATNYRLSKEAEFSLEEILDYTAGKYGLKQAEDYKEGIKATLEIIAQSPKAFQLIPDLRDGTFRRSVYKAHSIYYCIADDGSIEIMDFISRQKFI